jgi:hypothetical protein
VDHARRALVVFVERHRHHVEAIARGGGKATLGEKEARGADYLRLLAGTDRLQRVPGELARAGADLAEDAGPVLAERDEIELTLRAAPVALDDAEAGTLQFGGGQIFRTPRERRTAFERARQALPLPGGAS